ncbi:MAG: SDR family NAD(P)-dependent oxidoreductase, partial [Acetobacteraceae bacterium]
MDLRLADRTALLSGASVGIGRAIAGALAAEGVRLALVARRTDLIEALSAEIVAGGGSAPVPIIQDLMAPEAARTISAKALAALGRVEILVNCAGGSRLLPVDAPDAAWEEAMTLNFTRHRELTHRLLPQMISARWGRIISITGKSEPDRLNAAFAAKAAMHAWAKGLSREVGPHNITVNSIAPGRIM